MVLSSCTRKLMLRWSLLTLLVGELAIGVIWLLDGRMPVADKLLVATNQTVALPVVVSRWIDPVVMMVPMAVLVAASFQANSIRVRWTNKPSSDASVPIVLGVCFGFCGSLVIVAAGFPGLILGSIVSTIIVYWSCYDGVMAEHWQGFLLELSAVTTIWLLNTLYQGCVAGLLYALAALAVVTITNLLIRSMEVALPKLGNWFSSTMLTCDIEP